MFVYGWCLLVWHDFKKTRVVLMPPASTVPTAWATTAAATWASQGTNAWEVRRWSVPKVPPQGSPTTGAGCRHGFPCWPASYCQSGGTLSTIGSCIGQSISETSPSLASSFYRKYVKCGIKSHSDFRFVGPFISAITRTDKKKGKPKD